MRRALFLAIAILLGAVIFADDGSSRYATDPQSRARVLYWEIYRSDDYNRTLARHLIECGDAAFPYLVRLLRSDDSDKVKIGLRGLAQLKPKGMVREVARFLDREELRTEVIKTLGLMGDRSAVPLLRAAYKDPSYLKRRKTIVGSLAILGDDSVSAELLKMADNGISVPYYSFYIPDPNLDKRGSSAIAVEAISQFEPERRWNWIRNMLESGIEGRQHVAGRVASSVGEIRAKDLLLMQLNETIAKHNVLSLSVLESLREFGDERVEKIILDYIEQGVPPGYSGNTVIFSHLARFYSETSQAAVRKWIEQQEDWVKAAEVASHSNDVLVIEDLRVRMQKITDKEFSRLHALFSRSSANMNPQTLDIFLEMFSRHWKSPVIKVVTGHLIYFEYQDILLQFFDIAESDLPQERLAFAGGLSSVMTKNALYTLLQLVDDPDEGVRAAAKKSLRMHGVVLRTHQLKLPATWGGLQVIHSN